MSLSLPTSANNHQPPSDKKGTFSPNESKHNDLLIDNSKKEEIENIGTKKYNFVIIGFGDLGKGWHQILTEAGQNVYVCSLNGRQYNDPYSHEHHVHAHNVYNLPIANEDIDIVLICCTATDLDKLHDCLPKALIEQKASTFVFFQNGIGIREKIKSLFLDTPYPTQVIPYFSFKTGGGETVKISLAKPSPITGDTAILQTLTSVLNQGPHQNHWFEGMDSIVLRKEERKKGYINALLNTICVIYKLPVQQAISAFMQEFGEDALDHVYQEFTDFNNTVLGDELAHMSYHEIQEDIENAIKKFATLYPSTFVQYYITSHERKKVYSDDAFFIGTIHQWCQSKNRHFLILDTLYTRLQKIKKKIDTELAGH